MIIIDNDYMVNERGIDVRYELKKKSNASNIADIFFKQLSYRMYDYISKNSTDFYNHVLIDSRLSDDDSIEHFKRALSEQALYLLTNGDLTFILPDGGFSYDQWQKMRICPASNDILDMLGMINRTAVLR